MTRPYLDDLGSALGDLLHVPALLVELRAEVVAGTRVVAMLEGLLAR